MASKYIQKFPVPQNFPEILHDLSKEILRNQPEDIIEFCAMYFKCGQEGLVLDYPRKGKNIPCDFKPSIPKISTKISTMKEITAEDETVHKAAVQGSAYVNDPVHHAKLKEENKKKTENLKVKGKKSSEISLNKNSKKDDDLNFVVHHRETEENEGDDRPSNMDKNSLIKSLTSDFVDDVITKVEHHRNMTKNK